jgi:tRNA threonylcarbamoyladenosine biosynthesis protein TsaB
VRPPETGGDEPLVLALDTASASGGVALVQGRAVLGEASWQVGGQQTSEVLPAAVRLWERAGITAADLDAVAVSAGPGSYTGLRVGFSLAKGMALARGLPVVAIPTLEAVAYQHRDAAARLCAVVDAGRGQLYVARFERAAGGTAGGLEPARRTTGRAGLPRQRGQVAVLTPDELAGRLAAERRPLLVCGELYPRLIDSLRAEAAPSVRFVSPAAALRRPAFLAELALLRLAAGAVGDPAPLQPLYLRRPA